MNDTQKDSAAVRIPPPLWYLGTIGIGLLLHYFVTPWPIKFTNYITSGGALTQSMTGWALLLFGLGFNITCIVYFRRTRQSPLPHTPTTEIIVSGPYRVSRNPIYLGAGVAQIGIGVLLSNMWIIVLVVPALMLVHYLAVLPEESYLENKFGDEYLRYKNSVRRWL